MPRHGQHASAAYIGEQAEPEIEESESAEEIEEPEFTEYERKSQERARVMGAKVVAPRKRYVVLGRPAAVEAMEQWIAWGCKPEAAPADLIATVKRTSNQLDAAVMAATNVAVERMKASKKSWSSVLKA